MLAPKMSNAQHYLKVTFVRTDGFTQLLTLGPDETVTVGRDLACDCRLEGRKVSRRHLRMFFEGDRAVRLVDQGSHNGTFVNGERIDERTVQGGEVLNVGEWEGRVEFVDGPVRRRTVPGVMPAFASGSNKVARPSGVHGVQSAPHPQAVAQDPPTVPMPTATEAGTQAAANGPPLPRALRVSTGESDQEGGFDGVTDPAVRRINANETRRIDMKAVWQWHEQNPSEQESSQDVVRASPMGENPIVQRLSASQTRLDFQGLRDIGGKGAALLDPGKTSAGSGALSIDAVALQLVFKVTESLHRSLSIDDFLAEMTDNLAEAARAKAVVVLLPDENNELYPRVVKNRRKDESVQLSRTVIEAAVQQKAAVATEDASADERFSGGESVLRFDLKAVLCVPLVTTSQEVMGAVYITRDLPFSDTELDLVAALTYLVATGLDRSRLRDQIASEERQRRALERFHAPDVVRRLMMEQDPSKSARHDGLFLESLNATILFCDLSGFTRFCESSTPEEVGKVLNLYLGAMTELVFQHGGTVDKYIGDAIMCIFGAPFATDADALNAVRCAIDMRNTFDEMMARGDAGERGKDLKVHIGVNTGDVVAGTVGSSLRMEYTALGDTVNIAARLEGIASAGQIVIGPLTADLVNARLTVNTDDESILDTSTRAEMRKVQGAAKLDSVDAAKMMLEGYDSRLGGRTLGQRDALIESYDKALSDALIRGDVGDGQRIKDLAKWFGVPYSPALSPRDNLQRVVGKVMR